MKLLSFLLIGFALLFVGCGESDLDDPDSLNDILEEALDVSKAQDRNGLIYAPNDEKPYTGWVKELGGDGGVFGLMQFIEGKREGHYITWYENGQKYNEGKYKDGELISVSVWNRNGIKCPETTYKDGNGIIVDYYENGQKKHEAHYKDKKRDGPSISWDEEGKRFLEINYERGEKHGFCSRWDEINGKKTVESCYENGNKNGPETRWINGQKHSEQTYKEGKQDGSYMKWHENGNLSVKASYKDGGLHGKYSDYDQAGDHYKDTYYADGKMIDEDPVVWIKCLELETARKRYRKLISNNQNDLGNNDTARLLKQTNELRGFYLNNLMKLKNSLESKGEFGQAGLVDQELNTIAAEAPVISCMQLSVARRDVSQFSGDQVISWTTGEGIQFEGKDYQTGLVTFEAETIFGKQQQKAIALIQNGEVVKWLWSKSYLEMQ